MTHAGLQSEIERLFDRLWPINRSITGPGVRKSIDVLSEIMPMERLTFASGESIFDWTVPKEWTARSAYILTPAGERIADLHQNNLHLVGYSRPVHATMSLDQLQAHLHTLPHQPTAIPYVTSYYADEWGFCMPYIVYRDLPAGDYEVVIDTELVDGRLEVGEAVLAGSYDDEVLFSSYICHPSMANNELSGPLVVAFLYDRLRRRPEHHFTYRFVLNVETIGTLCYLSRRGDHLRDKLRAGYVLTCVGDRGDFTLKTSRDAPTLADRVARVVLRDSDDLAGFREVAFDASRGSEERQYCSPGFNLPMASITRTPYGEYPEYHTSLDNKSFISFDALAGSVDLLARIVSALEGNRRWKNTVMFGEPQLGRRQLYPKRSADQVPQGMFRTIKWLLNLADGSNDLLSIAERSGMPMHTLVEAAGVLADAGLLEPCDG